MKRSVFVHLYRVILTHPMIEETEDLVRRYENREHGEICNDDRRDSTIDVRYHEFGIDDAMVEPAS